MLIRINFQTRNGNARRGTGGWRSGAGNISTQHSPQSIHTNRPLSNQQHLEGSAYSFVVILPSAPSPPETHKTLYFSEIKKKMSAPPCFGIELSSSDRANSNGTSIGVGSYAEIPSLILHPFYSNLKRGNKLKS